MLIRPGTSQKMWSKKYSRINTTQAKTFATSLNKKKKINVKKNPVNDYVSTNLYFDTSLTDNSFNKSSKT